MYSTDDQRPCYYIGISTTFHDPAFAIIDPTGEILYAESSERRLQDKRAIDQRPDSFMQMPDLLSRFCNPESELVVATTWSRSYSALSGLAALSRQFTFPAVRRYTADRGRTLLPDLEFQTYGALNYNVQSRAGLGVLAGAYQAFGHNRVHLERYNHHLTHAAHACFTSPFEDAICAVVDGLGEFSSTAYYRYRDGRIQRLSSQLGFQSLGGFYSMLTDLCGFQSVRDEQWKVMGLAAYGNSDEELEEMLRSLCFVRSGRLRVPKRKKVRSILDAISSRVRPYREDPLQAAALAHAGQKIFAENMTALLRPIAQRGLSENIILAGGCALNSAYNGRVLAETGFRRLYVPAAPSDDGNAVGAALIAQRRRVKRERWRLGQHGTNYPYLGSALSSESIKRVETLGLPGQARRPLGRLAQEVARLLAAGKVVGWLQGRAEFGPRALGNRSILADPRNPSMKDRLNQIVKFREDFRPFAPAILDEYGTEYFEDYQFSPHMERALRFRPRLAKRVPAVVHVDGTGRLQSVVRSSNCRFYDLIEAFRMETGIPLLLNTSCNVMHKPMVHSVEDAVGLFCSTGLDVLVLDDLIIEK